MNWASNPLYPHTPDAPPWDEEATAKGVYITNKVEIAKDYAETCADEDGSMPLIVEIDISGKTLQIDPQAIDLLQEPYHLYRQDLLSKAVALYNEPILEMRHMHLGDMSKEERKKAYRAIREKQGPVFDFVIDFLTDSGNYFPEVKAQFPSAGFSESRKKSFALEKQDVAHIIFPNSWSLISSMHDFYQSDAPRHIKSYMSLQLDEDESIYSSSSVYLDSKHPNFDADFWYYLSNFAYLESMVPDEDISAIYSLEDRKASLIYKRDHPAKRKAFHGSCVGRVGAALKKLT